MTSQGSCHNSFAQSQSSSISTTSSLFSSHPLSNPVPSTSRSLISLPAMESVKKCRRCIAKAAKDWKEKVCSLRRKSDPGTRADYPSDFTDSSERHVSFNDELYQHTRGRRRTRSSSLNSKQVNGRISSRSSSSPGSISTKCEYSPPPSHRFPIPDPNIALPTPLTTLFRRCTTSCHLTPSNNASRSCMIKASCIPQLEWRRADCRDWIAACFREVYGLSAPCALKKASRQMEAGDRIYYTQLWIWEERWPCCGKEMYYRLQECRNKGMVRGVKPERGHREFIPVEYRCGFVEEKE
ncbi:hypothetical protein DL98DRAFT_510503 [Cadophora sp. DSE1049]|nr:hypothetical protein DL98DRAFT_510503 [Cadophora sp. DSE1049]